MIKKFKVLDQTICSPEKLLTMLLNDETIQENNEGSLTDPGKRVIAKKGREFLAFRMEDIAYFYIENGISYLIERKSNYKYIADKPLKDIESMINSPSFFRVTKKYLVHINAVVKFRSVKGGKLQFVFTPHTRDPIIVRQLKVPSFKRWLLQD